MMTIYLLRRVFRVRIKCIVTAQIELPDELFSYATIVSQSMTSVQSILLTRVRLRMGYVCVYSYF